MECAHVLRVGKVHVGAVPEETEFLVVEAKVCKRVAWQSWWLKMSVTAW